MRLSAPLGNGGMRVEYGGCATLILMPVILAFYLLVGAIVVAVAAVVFVVAIVWGLGRFLHLVWHEARKNKREGRPPPFHSQAQYSDRR